MIIKNPLTSFFLVVLLSIKLNVYSHQKHFIYSDNDVSETTIFQNYFQDKKSTNFQLITNGRPGQLYIDRHWRNQEELVLWFEKILDNSIEETNIYGCEFAKGDYGQSSVKFLKEKLNPKGQPPSSDNETYANNDTSEGLKNEPQTGNVLVNDYDPESDLILVSSAFESDGTPIVIDGVTMNPLPSGGKISLDPVSGIFNYIPATDFVGTEMIIYTICDNGSPNACDRASLYLTTLNPPVFTPVELVLFLANAKNENAILNWETRTESNSAYFQIERSTDGISFDKVDQISAAGDSQNELKYSYLDKSAMFYGRLLYYRLKQVDLDQKFTYSQVRLVTFDDKLKVETRIFPNPSSLGYDVNLQGNDIKSLSIYNSMGANLKTYRFDSIVQSTSINTDPFQSGLYFIVINNAEVQKLVIK